LFHLGENNASAGGSTIGLDVNQVHPDNINLAFNVAKLFNLDIAGIDLIISDISKSWLNTPCVICDVNAHTTNWI
jgi:cyanophycin synthetase